MTAHSRPQKAKAAGRPESQAEGKNGAPEGPPASERLYRTIFENTGTALIIIEEDGLISLANREFEKITGYPLGEIVGLKTWMEFMAPEHLDFMLSQHRLRRVSPGSALRRYEFRLIDKAGRVHDISLAVDLVPGTKQSVASMIDITEHKRAEETRRFSEERFSIAFNNSPIGMALTSIPEGNYVDVNEALLRATGYTREEVIGKNPVELGILDRSERDDVTGKAGSSGPVYSMEMHYRRRTGEVRDCLISMARITIGRGSYFLSSTLDITERKQVEKALKESEALIKAVLDNLPVGVAIYSGPPLVFEYMNDNFPRFYRTSREALGAPDAFWEAVYEDPRFREEIRRKVLEDIASGDAERMAWADIPITRRGEETLFVSAMTVPLPGRARMISLVSDVTARIKDEENLKKRLKYEETLSRISSQVAAVLDMEVFQEEALKRLGTVLDISRVYIFAYRKETDTWDNTHEWAAPGCRAQKEEFQNFPAASMPWWMEQMRRNTVLNFDDVEDMPDEKTREIMRAGDVRSVLIMPLFIGGELFGFMGFDECRRKRGWPAEDVDLLVSISRIISWALERKQAERTLAEQLDELRRWQSVTLGRETRLLDLKREINELLRRAGLPPRYSSPEGEEL